ncbi:MAG: hypothetical protein ACUVTZ_11565 [Armatimonadota bacterium]
MKCMRGVFLMMVVGLTALCAVPEVEAASEPTGFLLKTIQYRGEQTRYVVYVPENYSRSTKWPTIIFLNGYG